MNELLLYGEIGWEITSKDVETQLAGMDGDVTVRISSGGGDVYEGIAIMNALRRHVGKVTVVVEGLAASAASFIAVGGADRVVCRPHAELMIHEAWTFTDGDAAALQKVLADLERISGNLASIYAEKAGGAPEEWRELMRAETWFSAEEALAAGLVDAVEDARAPVAAEARRPVMAKMLAKFKYSGREVAPDPVIVRRRSESSSETNAPSSGQEGGSMSFLNKLAQELGKDPEVMRAALTRFMNEDVEVPGTVTVSYPDGVDVVPTGKVTVAPLTPLPEGVEVTAVAPENFTAEVDADGVVTVRATDGVSVGDVGDVVVTIAAGGEPVEVTVKAAVVAADSEDDGDVEEGAEPMAPGVPVAPPTNDQVTLDQETYAELRAAAQFGWKAMETEKENKLVAEVDTWVREGRISAARRGKAVEAMKKDPALARDLYGSNPVNTIPRAEVGYGQDVEADKSDVPSREELETLSKSRTAGKKN